MATEDRVADARPWEICIDWERVKGDSLAGHFFGTLGVSREELRKGVEERRERYSNYDMLDGLSSVLTGRMLGEGKTIGLGNLVPIARYGPTLSTALGLEDIGLELQAAEHIVSNPTYDLRRPEDG